MNFHIPICELRHQKGLVWTTLGLGPLTKIRTGKSGAKLRKSLIERSRKEIADLNPGEAPVARRAASAPSPPGTAQAHAS